MRALLRWLPELALLAVVYVVLQDARLDGKYSKLLLSWKKYSGPAFYIGVAVLVYLAWRQLPQTQDILVNYATGQIESQSPLARMLLRDWMRMYQKPLVPGMDAASPAMAPGTMGGVGGGGWGGVGNGSGGGGSTRRAVSETRKKFVAASQSWSCGMCRAQLDHTFEVDHRTRLEHGGSNEVDNLVALCRNCHGRKTASENM